jgi:sortase A
VKSREKDTSVSRPLTGLTLLTETAATTEAPGPAHEVERPSGADFEPAAGKLGTPVEEAVQAPRRDLDPPEDGSEGKVAQSGEADRKPPAKRRRPRRHARRRSTKAAILTRTAYALLGAGALLLAFVAYQLWGTAIYEGHAQTQLRHELESKYGVASDAATTTFAQRLVRTEFGTSAHVAKTVPDPSLGQPVGLMSIPRIGMTNDAIVEGTGEAQLEEGPGHYQGTPLPGEAGNSAIAGHRTTYAAPFFNLNLLQPGDPVLIVTPQGHFLYVVERHEIVDPGNTSVLDSSTQPLLTLTTCNPRYSATSRLVVVAQLRTSVLASGSVAAAKNTPSSREPAGSPGGQSTSREVIEALCWGALAAALAILTCIGWRRLWGLRAGLVLLVGVPAFVVTLLLCFAHVSLALPQTF